MKYVELDSNKPEPLLQQFVINNHIKPQSSYSKTDGQEENLQLQKHLFPKVIEEEIYGYGLTLITIAGLEITPNIIGQPIA